ncbi:MAG: aryl-sulfate sulfotransferase [Gemmataceae bacterium]
MRRRIEGVTLRALAASSLALAILALSARGTKADDPAPKPKGGPALSINDPRAFQGYTLISPFNSPRTYLIDMQGRAVKVWQGKVPSGSAYLLDNGHLLRLCSLQGKEKAFGGGPGAAGRVQELTWDGEVVWDYTLFNDKQLSHHDVCKLPNGNVLMVVWDKKTDQEAIAAGRRPEWVRGSYLLPDSVLEVKPTGKTTGEVVWEWHLWDHLIQDHDKTKANYGNVAEHPERVDVNFSQDALAAAAKTKDGAEKLAGIGYVASPTAAKQRVNPDWTHVNAVAYNPELDQIALTVHAFSEVWVIDHSTTTAEAAGSKGGRGGKGGDLLYRWGNPRVYRAGTAKDQKLWHAHFAHWVPKGYPGEGHLILFNNGMRRPDGAYSSVEEFALPVDKEGRYTREPGKAFGPDGPVWKYTAPKKTDFFSMIISGAHRLPNGNTLICSGVSGVVFEVTPKGETVWKYVNPARGEPMGPLPAGVLPAGVPGPPQPGEVLPAPLHDALKLTAEQKKTIGVLNKESVGRLAKVLTAEQLKQLQSMQMAGPGGFTGVAPPGQVLSPFQQARLKLTAEQKKEVAALQKGAVDTLDRTLDAAQKKQLKQMGDGKARGGPGGPPPFTGPTPTSMFRSYRFGPDHPGLVGKELKPGKTLEEMEPKAAEPKGGKK